MVRLQENEWKVLLIDNDEEARHVMTVLLKEIGYTVLTASEGKTGIELCREELPPIVVTEMDLPDTDGVLVLTTLKQVCPNSEVVIATAHGDMEKAVECFRRDAADFITKPIGKEALAVSIDRARKRYMSRNKLQEYTTLMEERWMDASEALSKTYKFQERLIESSIDGIIGCDYDRKIIIFNKSMEQMLGYSKDMVIGKAFLHQLFSSEGWDKFQDQLYGSELGGEDKLFLSEFALISKAGEKIPVRLSAQVLFQENQEIGIVIFLRDLRIVKRLKQQFLDQAKYLHQDKMVSMGKLAASVVHEINNPLTGVQNYISLMSKILSRGTLPPEKVPKFQRYLELMGSEVKRSSEIVSSLLAFSRKSRLEFGDVDVGHLLQRSILLSKHKLTLQNIEVKTDLDPGLPLISGDFNQLQQCVLNLIFNAADAMPEGGTLTVETGFVPENKCVQVLVRDTGHGIAEENLTRIFDPFFSTKQEGKGLGLGLSVVYGIIDRHKGTITAESDPGIGTVFRIQIPALARAADK